MVEILNVANVRGRYEITLPKEIRDFLKVTPGDILVFSIKDKIVSLKKGEIRISG